MQIDLNSDSGESFSNWRLGDDQAMMAIVTSANVACGFHAGDPSVMRETVSAAAAHGVAVGAHVSYRDLYNFGRSFIDVAPAQLRDEVIYQIGALQAIADVVGTKVSYVKPHGGLYNAIVHHADQAQAVADAIAELDDTLAVLCLPNSVIGRIAAQRGLRVVYEAFADRAYNPDGTLVSRRTDGAVLLEPDEIAARVVRMATQREVVAIDGQVLALDAESVCVHGDSPGAVAIAKAIRTALDDAGVTLAAFA